MQVSPLSRLLHFFLFFGLKEGDRADNSTKTISMLSSDQDQKLKESSGLHVHFLIQSEEESTMLLCTKNNGQKAQGIQPNHCKFNS